MTITEKHELRLSEIDCDGCEYEEECDRETCKARDKEIKSYDDEMDRQIDMMLGK